MEESLIKYLLADTALSALVGTRIYWVTAPEKVAAPYIRLTKVSAVRDYTTQAPTGLINSIAQVDVFAETYKATKAVARLVEARLSGYRGAFNTTTFQGVFLNTERDIYLEDDTTFDMFGVSLDFNIWHKET